MTKFITIIAALLCMLSLSTKAQSRNNDLDDVIMLAAADTSITAEISEEQFKARASFSLAITPAKKTTFSAVFDHFNIVLYDVEQRLLAKEFREESSSSPVGFRVLGRQRLAFDPEHSVIVGSLEGVVDYAHQNKLVPTEIGSNRHHHIENPPAQLASLDVEIKIPREFVEHLLSDDDSEEKRNISVKMLMQLEVLETEYYRYFFIDFESI
ncbi:MAG: hypothetical protein AAF699_16610 [Pseudomonadota bacterium]